MIYFVSGQPNSMFENETYRRMNVNDAVKEIESWTRVQFDIETNGLDPHIAKMTCMQFGNKSRDIQIVVDTSTTSVTSFKEILETKFIIGHNLKFDFQFLYNYKIVPTRVYDTMIVEQLRYLGYDHSIRYNLSEVLYRNMNTQMDKRIREEIHWRGLDDAVIQYAANDVVYLEDIMEIQLNWCHQNTCLQAAKLECDFVPVIAYLEWCGIKLDVDRWTAKMARDKSIMDLAKIELDAALVKRATDGNPRHRNLKAFTKINRQGDLFNGFNLEPQCTVNWKSSPQTIGVLTSLGFDCTTIDKKTGEETESALAKLIKKQKGIDDEFLDVYFTYTEAAKDVSTYGQSYLNAINPKTGRIHTTFRQLGADTGRMACGSSKTYNSDLAKLKNLPRKLVSYPQLQNLPSDTETRASFVSEPDNYMVACDYSALESRLGADIYEDQAMIDEFLYGSGDMHSLVAKFSFKEIAHLDVKTIKKEHPNLRQRAKGVGFSQQFGGTPYAIRDALGCTLEEAIEIADLYNKGFKGIAKFKKFGSKFVRDNGYILLCKYTGHKAWWPKHDEWKKRMASRDSAFWDFYRVRKAEDKTDPIVKEVRDDFITQGKFERKALNSPTQGTGIIILKKSMTRYFRWIVDNGYFGIVLLCNLVHDEAVSEYPKTMTEVPNIMKKFMEEAAAEYCKALPIPAEYNIAEHWVH